MRSGRIEICGPDLNGDNLRISTAYLWISDHCRVRIRIRIRVRVWVMVRVRVRVRIKVRVRVGFRVANCCIKTAGEGDKMRINNVIKTDQWRCAPQIRSAPHFVVSRFYCATHMHSASLMSQRVWVSVTRRYCV